MLIAATALVVGAATLAGAALGFCLRRVPRGLFAHILAFSAGIMLAAAVTGLILPSLTWGGKLAPVKTTLGIFAGAMGMRRLEHRVPPSVGANRQDVLFLAAMLIHKLPESMAAGVGFGTGDMGEALMLAGGIALQNIPEGMVVILPMLSMGMRPGTVVLWSVATAAMEALATLAGYGAVTLVSAALPFSLAFAGGTMLYVLLAEMLPQAQRTGSTMMTLAGFCAMLLAGSG